MVRKFKTVDYEAMLKQSVLVEECLPPTHLARFIVQEIAQLDLSEIYATYGAKGGIAIAPEVLLGLLFYGYATGVFSSRGIEKATYESIPFRFIAGGLHPDHDTIAHFRKRHLGQIKGLFTQVLQQAQANGVLKLEDLSLDGSKIHADASKHHAVSYGHLVRMEFELTEAVETLLTIAEQVEQGGLTHPDAVNLSQEIERRQAQLAELSQAKAVLQQRAEERYQQELTEYTTKVQQREAKAKATGRKPRGFSPSTPRSGSAGQGSV